MSPRLFGLTTPDGNGSARAAQPIALLSCRPARTPSASVLGECGDENGMAHRIPPLGAIRPWMGWNRPCRMHRSVRTRLLRGRTATGRPGRLCPVAAVLMRPAGPSRMPNERLPASRLVSRPMLADRPGRCARPGQIEMVTSIGCSRRQQWRQCEQLGNDSYRGLLALAADRDALLERIRNETLDVYRASPIRLREDASQEAEIAHDYQGRLIRTASERGRRHGRRRRPR